MGPRAWSSEALGHLGAASVGLWFPHLIWNQTSGGPAVTPHPQATQPTMTDTAKGAGGQECWGILSRAVL